MSDELLDDDIEPEKEMLERKMKTCIELRNVAWERVELHTMKVKIFDEEANRLSKLISSYQKQLEKHAEYFHDDD